MHGRDDGNAPLYATVPDAMAERRCTVWTVHWTRPVPSPLAAPARPLAANQIGSRTSKVAPLPRSLAADTLPPSSSTTLRLM